MAQQTNLNVSPYFDDFDPNDNYHRVLFKPGYPVQARELTGLQSILQNQIERFGQHFFKEGAKVIPGNTAYSRSYQAVELNNTHLGVPVDFYIDQLVDRKVIGLTSGVTAYVKNILKSENSERGNLTLYLSYLSSGVQDSEIKTFLDGELLATDVDIISGPLNNPFIPIGESFCSTISTNATSTGSAFSISNGVYFIRGNFVNVSDETLILSQYQNNASGRVGLKVLEEIVNSDTDENLTDNSKGFNNFASPGADRLKISCSLTIKSLDDFNDSDFIELATIRDGVLDSQVKNTEYSIIADELARRTYAESGDYTVMPFDVTVRDSLDDGVSTNGVYTEGRFTQGGSLASEDLALYEISPGKAFVKGYEVETINTTYLDVSKPRTTKKLEKQEIIFNTGATFKTNKVFGAPTTGIGNTYILSLRDRRVGSSSETLSGKEIGLARVYDFALESGSYSATNADVNQWDLQLYDIQTFSHMTLNEPITLTVPVHVKGKYSGATAFLRENVSVGAALTVYERSGDFVLNEPLIFDGIENSRVAIAITSAGISDIKSVYGGPSLPGGIGAAVTFTADTVLDTLVNVGVSSITATVGAGSPKITAAAASNFLSKVKVGSILKFTTTDSATPIGARVTSVNAGDVTVTGVTTVTGVLDGDLPPTARTINDLKIVGTKLSASAEDLDANALYTTMPKQFISDVDLISSNIIIRKTFTVNIATNKLSAVVTAGANETFLAFDEERYTLIRSNGATEELTADRFSFTNGGKELQINNLGANDTGATLFVTLRKSSLKEKIKRQNRVNTLVVDKSINSGAGTGSTTLNNGLTFGNFPFGTRVEDERISLNKPDIIRILGVYESTNTSAASAPQATLSAISGFTGKTSDLIVGEFIVGQSSGARAVYTEKLTDSQITYVPRTDINFTEGETIVFSESNITATLTTLNTLSRAISNHFEFNTGQKSSIYGQGFLKRKSNARPPTRQLKVYFANAYFEDTDDGDLITKNSYESFDYDLEIQTVNGERNTDLIDIRPRVSDYTVSESSRSPLEFLGRSYNGSGNSVANILASDESINLDFSFYLGRYDRIFMTKNGRLQVQQGAPSENFERPVPLDDALEIATVKLQPYLLSTEDATVSFLEHKRYRMSDIKKLEDRIRSLEYYTTLSLLEVNTESLFVADSEGLNRFKSGFFVDDFTTLLPQDTNAPINNSLDVQSRELRPRHFTNSIDLTVEPVEGVTTQTDLGFTAPDGENIKRSSDIITLDYTEIEWLKQNFATRTESITPFLVSFWQASVELSPSSDTWVDTARVEAKIVQTEGNYAEEMAKATRRFGEADPQTGFFPVQWNSWQTTWTGTEQTQRDGGTRTETRPGGGGARTVVRERHQQGRGGRRLTRTWTESSTTTTFQDTITDTFRIGTDNRRGQKTLITERFDQTSMGDRVISRDLIALMRSRNIQFVANKVRPLTRIYPFFDSRDVSKYCVPKLLEITMTSGVFQVGETVFGKMEGTGLGNRGSKTPAIRFRVAQANHKEGPFNAPTQVYRNNPYLSQVSPTAVETFLGTPGQVQVPGQGNVLPETYSSTSSVLNVDTYALSLQAQGEYFGYVAKDMVLVGQTSGAQATISSLRLMSDLGSTLIGSFYIPDPNIGGNPKFETGDKTFTLVDDSNNDQNVASTIGEQKYTAKGTLETVQEQIVSVRNAEIQIRHETESKARRDFFGSSKASTVIDSVTTETTVTEWYDPLAQSFQVLDETGVFVTSCDVFFQTKDDMDIPMTFQIRTMQNGVPTQKILPFSEIILTPDQINISADGTVPTTFNFKAPVYLEGGGEYAITLASWSTKYRVFISRVGESDLLTDEFISNQPYLGSLFKSQNASTWEPSQWEDLKFTIRRADFVQNGSLEVYNPILGEGNGQIPTLQPDSINISSKKIRVGLGTTVFGSNALEIGNTFSQQGSNATGNFVGSAGSGTGALTITNAGIGYTPSSGALTYTGVALTSITGSGQNLTANISVNNGVAVGATVVNGGSGYVVGDVLGISSLGNNPAGRNARFSLVSLASTNEIIFDNVQGDFEVGVGKTLQFTNSSGSLVTLNGANGNVTPTEIRAVGNNDGLHLIVDHKNHGMYHENNRVTISGVESDVVPTKLTSPYSADSTADLLVENSSEFSTFENIGVGTTTAGYVKIGDEILTYTDTSTGTISGITRGSNSKNYVVGTPVYKYEMGGVSLRRVNKTHVLNDATLSNPIGFDSYTIKVDMSSDGVNRSVGTNFPVLYYNETKSDGGYDIKATQNMPFEAIVPSVQNVTVPGTTISATVRTTTGSNLSNGSGQNLPVPFNNAGTEDVTLNATNYFSSPRIIASRVNETNSAILQQLPGDRSFNMSISLESSDSRLSPIIDAQRVSAILVSNRVDAPISNYAEDNRVNSIDDDPNAFQYISGENTLETSATSIKILLTAHINQFNDIRAFYAIGEDQGFTPIFEAFPGYTSNNDGSSDRVVPPANASEGFLSRDLTFKEHEFSVDNLPAFKSYRIKLIATSTNQAYAPRIKELRTITLA